MNSLALIVMFYNLAKQYAKTYADKLLGRVATGFNWLGAVKYYADLPTSANEGDAYTVMYEGTEDYEADGTEYAWGQLDGALQWIPVRTKGDTGSQGKQGEPGQPGEPGKDGEDGQPGADGYSPTATVEKIGDKAVITIEDKNGTTTATIYDGKNGESSGAIDIIKVNGTAQDIEPADKSVNITVPSVEGLASEEFVTDGFVAKENGKGLSTNDFSDANKEKLDGLENYDDSTLSQRVSDTEDAISTLNGTGAGSVTKTVSDEIAKVVSDAPEDLDTLKEISDWISGHADDAAAMNSAIQQNAGDISSLQTEVGKKANSEDVTKELAKKANSDDVTKELAKKADKVTGATQGNVAALDADGNFTDSGVKPLSVSVTDMTICFTEK